MARKLSEMYRVKWRLRSVDPELMRPRYTHYRTARTPVYSAVPQGNAQDLLVNNLTEKYVVVGDTRHDYVILDYR